MRERGQATPPPRGLVHSLVPLVAIGVVLGLAALLASIILTSPSAHEHLVP